MIDQFGKLKREDVTTVGKTDIIYRIISWGKYNREDDKNPKFLCRNCSLEKMNLIIKKKRR